MTGTCEFRTAVVIEGDGGVRDFLTTVLEPAGFVVRAAASGTEGVALVTAVDPVVTTLGVTLPDIDGFEAIRRIREISDTYVILIGENSDEIDILQGLEAGADDYVSKPLRGRELRARVEAMLRRPRHLLPHAGTAPPVAHASGAIHDEAVTHGALSHNGLVIDLTTHLALLDGKAVRLTPSEFTLAATLLRAPHRVLTKDELAGVLWCDRYAGGASLSGADRRALEVHMANLRRKLGGEFRRPRIIETVRGVGYRLTPQPSR